MALLRSLQKIAFLTLLFLMVSCVKDIDLEKIDQVVLPTEAAVDLVYFTLSADGFYSASGQSKKVSDIVRLEFLDDDYVQTSLVSAHFHFRFLNSFETPFLVTVQLLSPSNDVMHSFRIPIPAGRAGDPEIINYTEFISGSGIQAVRNSINMRLEIEMQDPSKPQGGELRMESRGVFKFEFK